MSLKCFVKIYFIKVRLLGSPHWGKHILNHKTVTWRKRPLVPLKGLSIKAATSYNITTIRHKRTRLRQKSIPHAILITTLYRMIIPSWQ